MRWERTWLLVASRCRVWAAFSTLDRGCSTAGGGGMICNVQQGKGVAEGREFRNGHQPVYLLYVFEMGPV